MRVVVDARTLVKPGRGVARVTRGLLEALATIFPRDQWVVVAPGEAIRPLTGIEIVRSRAPRRLAFGAAAIAGRPRLDRMAGGEADVVWLPEPAPVAVSAHVPLVLTLHDLSWARRPRDFTSYERLWHRLGRLDALARRATATMAVSEATRSEAIARWGLAPERVVVVRPGVGPVGATDRLRSANTARRLGLPPRFLLYVGALEPRKAPDVLAAAYMSARASGLDAALAVVGEGRERALLVEAGATLLGRVGDDDLAALYAQALAVVLPSRLEGLGLPPLEGLAHGTPAVVSDLPALRETLGDAALYVQPGDARSLAKAMRHVADDAALRERLLTVGRPRLKALRWDRAARDAHAVLVEAAR